MVDSALPRAHGLLRVVSPEGVIAAENEQNARFANNNRPEADIHVKALASHIRKEFDQMKRHRNGGSGWSERLLNAQRVFNGKYDAQKLNEIRRFGGSEVYARVIAVKARGASALLREVYLGHDKPWGLDPSPDPVLPDDVVGAVADLVNVEAQTMAASGQPVQLTAMKDRTKELMEAAKRSAKKKAQAEAKTAENKLDDKLVEGGFYKALAEFIADLPLFPFACIKGPVVRIVPDVVWRSGAATIENRAKMFWSRVSPFDIFFTPGVADIEDASVIERVRLTRADLNDLLGLPGYDEDAIRNVLDEYGRGGLRDWADTTDGERAQNESREDPNQNHSGLIDCLEFHGNVQGRTLLEFDWPEDQVPDEDKDYFVQAWLIGRHVIKVQIAPSPRKRHPYYITSFEKVPGTPVGNALPDILHDIQDVCNAALRSLVNNLSIASGPQVVIDDDRADPNSNTDDLYPWKRWHVSRDPGSSQGSIQPVYFFQPNSHAGEFLGIYEKFTQIADELSAIPRYITGSDRMGGAGRTASGLAMLMGNASKILQTVAANIDRDVINPLLQSLYDMIMLTDETGTFKGDESIKVRGVDVAVQRETNRQRQIEFLTATANPIDMGIVGPDGRAKVLRTVASTIGMDGEDIVPSEEELKARLAPPPTGLPPGMPGAPGGPAAPPPLPGDPSGQPSAPGLASGALGQEEGNAMRGMVPSGAPAFAQGGMVDLPHGMRLEIPPPPPPAVDVSVLLQELIETERAPIEFIRDPKTGRLMRMERQLPDEPSAA